MSSVTGNLCNKCPKQLVEQNSSYNDYFNAISGFTSNSRGPGGPVTLTPKMHLGCIPNAWKPDLLQFPPDVTRWGDGGLGPQTNKFEQVSSDHNHRVWEWSPGLMFGRRIGQWRGRSPGLITGGEG